MDGRGKSEGCCLYVQREWVRGSAIQYRLLSLSPSSHRHSHKAIYGVVAVLMVVGLVR